MLKIFSNAVADGTALTNTTTETPLDSVLLPAGTLQSGKVFRWQGKVRATATNSTDTLNVKLYTHTSAAIGGTAIGQSGAVDVADNDVVYWDLTVIPQSAAGSSAGTIEVIGLVTAPGAEGTATARVAHHQVTSVNYLADLYLVCTGTWSVASASNSCVAEASLVIEGA